MISPGSLTTIHCEYHELHSASRQVIWLVNWDLDNHVINRTVRCAARIRMNDLVNIPATTFLQPVAVRTRGHAEHDTCRCATVPAWTDFLSVCDPDVEFSAHWGLPAVAWQFQGPDVRHRTCVTHHLVFILHLCTDFMSSPCFCSTCCYHLNATTSPANTSTCTCTTRHDIAQPSSWCLLRTGIRRHASIIIRVRVRARFRYECYKLCMRDYEIAQIWQITRKVTFCDGGGQVLSM